MSSNLRQSELFASDSWLSKYLNNSLNKNVNFNASDVPSIHKSLMQYIQQNFAEEFNDYIASSEVIMILDSLVLLSSILAYKTDVSARENFLVTATSKSSVLRIAKFLSYNAKRNQCAKGFLKVIAVKTTDTVYDSSGNNLSNAFVSWGNSSNPEWFDQFVSILNSAFVSTNTFGMPISSDIYNSIQTQIYRFNNTFGDNTTNVDFSINLDSTSYNFEAYNMSFDSSTGFDELPQDPNAAFNFAYLSDGYGNTSANTGFFFGFKQGQTQSLTTNITTSVENQVIDVPVSNINQTDVWVQTVDSNGNVLVNWNPVPVMFTDNITFNSLPAENRNIFQVITNDNDQISIRFSDGRFGNTPLGLIKVTYRVSNGLQYQLRSSDIGNPQIKLSYKNRRGVTNTLTFVLELTTAISNSAPSETIDQIKRRASLVYATQNRMVSGDDYNAFPLQSNLATKIKALARTYSGQSRFIDLNDPTSNYSDTIVFADDGMFYSEIVPSYQEIPLSNNVTASQLISNYIQPVLQSQEIINWIRSYFLTIGNTGGITIPALKWSQTSSTAISSTGYFNVDSQFLRQGALLQFVTPTYQTVWAGIISVTGNTYTAPNAGLAGPVLLSRAIPDGSSIASLIPRYAASLTSNVITTMTYNINQTLSFGLWYDFTQTDETLHISVQPKNYSPSNNQFQLLSFDCLGGSLWRMSTIGLRYVFESKKAVQFYFNGESAVDIDTGQIKQDFISILEINLNIQSSNAFQRRYDLTLDKMIPYANGYNDPKRIAVKFTDSNNDGFPDDPDTFVKVVNPSLSSTYLFWQLQSNGTFSPFFDTIVFVNELNRKAARALGVGTVAFQINSTTAPNSFWIMTANGWTEDFRSYRYGTGRGSNVAAQWIKADGTLDQTVTPSLLRFKWQHYVPGDRRINPSRSNIIDVFVLATEYDIALRQWISNGCIVANQPTTLSDFDVAQLFSQYEKYKMFSDNIVWRPVQYRYLFGQTADATLRASFNVVKLANSLYSDGEVKSRVLTAINAFFAVDLWDFGETFYYTEMAAYIHSQLAGVISSCVIVPETSNGVFGDLFQVVCRPDEIFISTAQSSDINIVASNTAANLRIS